MPNITFSVSDDLYKRMKKFPEIKWTKLYRQMIEHYLEKLENLNSIPIKELREKLKRKGISMEDLTYEQCNESYKKLRKMEWERVHSTQKD